MNYTQPITRTHRSAYLLLLDLSGSMKGLITHNNQRLLKSEVAIEAINKIIQELYMRAMRDNTIRDYYDIAVIGYSAERVFSLLGAGDLDSPFVPITKLCDERCIKLRSITPLSRNQGGGGDSSTIEVESSGSTPMYEALYYIYHIVREWCSRPENINSFPPSIYHATDGHPTDCDLDSIVEISRRITSVGTNDGEALLFNIHLEDCDHSLKALFPTDEEVTDHHNAFVRMLGASSSIIPSRFEDAVREIRRDKSVGKSYRGMGYNASVTDLISMMTIGTLSTPMK